MSKKNEQDGFQLGKHYDESFQGLSPREIRDNLEGLAYAKEDGTYTKLLSENDLAIAKNDFATVGLKLMDIADRKKEAMEEFKHELKEPLAEQKLIADMIKNKSVRKDGILWLVDDQEKGMMYMFDENAICVDCRPLAQKEKQTSILRSIKTVNE